MKRRIPVAIDLFSGCGGFSTGLLDAGVRVVAGFDNERRAIEVYNYNHGYRGARGHVVDLGVSSGRGILELAGVSSVDLVVGGPPCQAFSIIGKQRGIQDERGMLLLDFVRLISEICPKAFILENVPNLAQIEDGRIFEQVKESFLKLGYSIRAEVLSVIDYGVAQMRRRLFMVGIQGMPAFPYPPPVTHSPAHGGLFTKGLQPFPTVKDAIDDLPDVDTREAEDVPNHEPTVHSPSMLAALADLLPGTRDPKSHHDRLHLDKPSYTLRAGSGNFSPLRPIHYKYDRVITVRESARIQGFSDDFIWPDSIPRLQQYRQVGNAVPPKVAAAVAHHLCSVLDWQTDSEGLRGDPTTRPPHTTRSAAERKQERLGRIRGASLGSRMESSAK